MASRYSAERRNFLNSAFSYAAVGTLAPLFWPLRLAAREKTKPRQVLMIGEGIERKYSLDETVPSIPRKVFYWFQGQKMFSVVDVPTPVHDFVQNPKDPSLVLCIPKWGTEICWIDLKAGKWIKKISSGEGRRFFGHGLVTPDGQTIILSEQNDRTGQGELSFRNIQNLKVLNRIESRGVYPHQVILTPDKKFLVVANWGGKEKRSCLSFFDSTTLTHVRSVELKESWRVGHLFMTQQSQVIAAGQIDGAMPMSEKSLVLVVKADHKIEELQVPEKFQSLYSGEVASFSLSPNEEVVSAINFSGQGVFSWDLESLKFIRHDMIPGAKALRPSSDPERLQLVRTASSSQFLQRVPEHSDFRLETHLANSRLILSPHLTELNSWNE